LISRSRRPRSLNIGPTTKAQGKDKLLDCGAGLRPAPLWKSRRDACTTKVFAQPILARALKIGTRSRVRWDGSPFAHCL
jgi:hypothetical protein